MITNPTGIAHHRMPRDLLAAAHLGARIAARARSLEGQDDETIRGAILGRFAANRAEHDAAEFAALEAAVRRGIEDVLLAKNRLAV